MIDANEYLEAGLQFHGHKCPAMPMGLRAGAAAMNRLGVGRAKDKELSAVVELGDDHCSHCFADGIQMVTGCTFGKGNLRKAGYGKFGVTLVDRESGQAVRVVPKAEAQAKMKQTPFFLEYRLKGVPPSRVPDAVVDPLIGQVMGAPEDGILNVGRPFPMDIGKPSETFASFVCDRCGETVVEKYGRVVGERKVCIPCQEKLLAGK
ncbi:MAG: FmdE family protein [Deltaproteobacteria bacterium]